MITKFKVYEDLDEPVISEAQIDDYVACEDYYDYDYDVDAVPIMRDFILNNVGKIAKCNYTLEYPYTVKYKIPKELPNEIKCYFDNGMREMSIKEVKFWSKIKKMLNFILQEKI